jgi:hypothetical protein
MTPSRLTVRAFSVTLLILSIAVGASTQSIAEIKQRDDKGDVGAKAAKSKATKEATIEFSPIHLALGMPKERVLTVLAEHYDISPWKGQGRDLWGVTKKAEPHFLVGTVSFEANTLSFASRMWENSNTAFSVIHVTANLLARLRDEGFSQCSISTQKESHAENELEREVIMIDCGQKSIAISSDRAKITNGDESETVDIVERLESAAPLVKKH